MTNAKTERDFNLVRNIVRGHTQPWSEKILEMSDTISPEQIDHLENEMMELLDNPKITRNHIRSEIVACILDNFGTSAFGVGKPKVNTEKSIKDYKKKYMRK
ncbi:hypothetical protein POP12_132 [Pectobacterium phage POP12]|nr:hypothetical protein POP12_132 [Pectobacterium phage POP12]